MEKNFLKIYVPKNFGMTKIVLIVIAFASIFSISISCFVLNKVIERHDEELIRVIAADVFDDIRNELVKPVSVARMMSNDIFLHEHLKLEDTITENEETEIMKNYLSTIKERFGYDTAFLASEHSKNYWHANGWVKKINPSAERHDIWYKNAVESKENYVLNVDTNEADNLKLGVFVNAKITDSDGNLLGVCGVGLNMDHVQKILEENEREHKIKINLVSQSGLVQVDTESERIRNIYLEKLNYQRNDQFILNKLEDGDYVVTRYFPQFNWYLVVQRDNEDVQGIFANLISYISASFLIGLIILLIFIQLTLRKEQKKIADYAQRHGIASQAGLYVSMHLVDLKNNTIFELSRNPQINLFVVDDGEDAENKIMDCVKNITAPESLSMFLSFVNLKTLSERMTNKTAIYQEFLSENFGWCKAYFMLADKNEKTHQLVFAIEIIDEEKRREKHLLYLSETDLMTGLRNRGSGEKKISDLMANGQSGMFCILDADKFKSVNDTYGHDVGDKVITAISDCLKKTFRNSDVVMRLGGDEFAVFAVDVVDEELGKTIIENLFNAVNKINIPELGERKISISLGAVIFTAKNNLTFEELYKFADSAAYISKKTLGNCSTFHEKI